MTRVLHTARTSNVDTIMFVNRIREMVNFQNFFLCPTLLTRRKTSFSTPEFVVLFLFFIQHLKSCIECLRVFSIAMMNKE